MLKKKLGAEVIDREWMDLGNYFKIPTTLVIPEGCKRIGRYAFRSCWWLKRVVIPGSVKEIGDWAFSGCWNAEIKLMKLKKSRLIERCAFVDCKKLIRE